MEITHKMPSALKDCSYPAQCGESWARQGCKTWAEGR